MNQKKSSGPQSEQAPFFVDRDGKRYGPFSSTAGAAEAGFHIEPEVVTRSSAIFRLAASDLNERDQIGWRNHGRALEDNPRMDWLREAYEEALDLCVYLRGALYKRDGK